MSITTLAIPSHIAQLPDRARAEWTSLSRDEQRLLTPEAFERWTRDLHPDDIDLEEIVGLEVRRQRALQTMRAARDLTEIEFRLLRFLQRNEARPVSYLRIARHLWETPTFHVTARDLRAQGGYAAPMVASIQTLVWSLRHKLEIDPLRPQHLTNIRGVGYVWYSMPPALDDGINYEQRAALAVLQRVEMRALIGGDVEGAARPDIARELDPTLGEAFGPLPSPSIEASYTVVDQPTDQPDG